MLSSLVIGVLCAATGPGQLSLAVPDFRTVGLEADRAGFYAQHIAQALGDEGARTITSRELAAVIGQERQRKLLGCGDEASCLAELANALGTDGIVVGDVAKIGQLLQINLRVVAASDGKAVASWSAQVEREEEVLDAMALAAEILARDASRGLARALSPTPGRTPRVARGPSRTWSYVAGAAGGVSAGLSIFSFTQSGARHAELRSTRGDPIADGEKLSTEGASYQTLGVVAAAASLAALTGAVFLYSVSSPSVGQAEKVVELRATVGPTGLTLFGVFP